MNPVVEGLNLLRSCMSAQIEQQTWTQTKKNVNLELYSVTHSNFIRYDYITDFVYLSESIISYNFINFCRRSCASERQNVVSPTLKKIVMVHYIMFLTCELT